MTVEQWEKQIRLGQRYKETCGYANNWYTYRGYLRGEFPQIAGVDIPQITYNITYAIWKVYLSSLGIPSPYITVTPRLKPRLHMYARVLESLLNWILRTLNVQKEIQKAITDCFVCNRAFLKLGYGFKRDLNTKGERLNYNVQQRYDMPWIYRVMPEHIIVPYGTTSLDDVPWIDHIIIKPLQDVKQSSLYRNTQNLTATHNALLYNTKFYDKMYREMGREVELVELHEIHDYRRSKLIVIVLGHSQPLRVEDDVLQVEGVPFVDWTFNDDGIFYWGTPEVRIFEPQQLEMNESRTLAMFYRRYGLCKLLARKGAISQDEINKLVNGDFLPIIQTEGDPNQAVRDINFPIPQDLMAWTDILRGDVREIMGISRLQMGEQLIGSRKTATEAGLVEQRYRSRILPQQMAIISALEKMAEKLVKIIFQMWDAPRVIDIVGVDAARYWVKVSGKELQDEYIFKLSMEAMMPWTKEKKKQQLIELISALGKRPDVYIQPLIRLLLSQYEFINLDEVFPSAQEAPMELERFVQHQKTLMNSPDLLNQRLGVNKAFVERALKGVME